MGPFEDQVKNNYFEWLYSYVCEGRANDNVSYRRLFELLHDIEFQFYIARDVNRARDGVDLRYRFAINKKDEKEIMDILDGPCSVLEMMIALAIRAETIMDDTRYGDRTAQWFWDMLSNLGLSYMTDNRFDKEIVFRRVYDFMERRYNPDGKGGLFYIPNCRDDLRDVEIWSQLCWYLEKYN